MDKFTIIDKINIGLVVIAVVYFLVQDVFFKAGPIFNKTYNVNFTAEELPSDVKGHWAYKGKMYAVYNDKLYKGDLKKVNEYVCDLECKDAEIIYAYDDKIFYTGYETGGDTYYYDLKKKKSKPIFRQKIMDNDCVGKINNRICFKTTYEKFAVYNVEDGSTDTYENLGDGTKLYTTKDGIVCLYSREGVSNEEIKLLIKVNNGQARAVVENDGLMYIFTYDEIRVFDIETEEVLRKIPLDDYYLQDFLFSENVYATKDDKIYVFNPKTEKFEVIVDDEDNEFFIVDKLHQVDDVAIIYNRNGDYGKIYIYKNNQLLEKFDIEARFDYFVDDIEKCIYYYNVKEKVYKKYNF